MAQINNIPNHITPRIRLKRSNVAGIQPTIPTSDNMSDGSMLNTDIMQGELFLNDIDNKLYYRGDITGGTIYYIEPDNKYVSQITLVGSTTGYTMYSNSLDYYPIGYNKSYRFILDNIIREVSGKTATCSFYQIILKDITGSTLLVYETGNPFTPDVGDSPLTSGTVSIASVIENGKLKLKCTSIIGYTITFKIRLTVVET